MLLNGKKIEQPNEEILVLPRPDGPIVFTARAVLDMTEFNELCPRPKVPVKRMKSGERIEETDNPSYVSRINSHASLHMAFIVIKSLEATEGLEWESVEMDEPSTWLNYDAELRASGFTDIEVNRIIMLVMDANGLNEAKLNQARQLFLQERQEQKDSSSQEEEASFTPSGEVVNDSV